MSERVTVVLERSFERESAFKSEQDRQKIVETKSLPLQFSLCSYVERTYF